MIIGYKRKWPGVLWLIHIILPGIMPEIKLTIGERTVTAPSGFDLADFIKTEGLEARKVYCGQLDPPIPISGTEFLEYVHFIDFFISGSKIKFMVPERINVDIPQIIKSLTLKIITPGNTNSKSICFKFIFKFLFPYLKP